MFSSLMLHILYDRYILFIYPEDCDAPASSIRAYSGCTRTTIRLETPVTWRAVKDEGPNRFCPTFAEYKDLCSGKSRTRHTHRSGRHPLWENASVMRRGLSAIGDDSIAFLGSQRSQWIYTLRASCHRVLELSKEATLKGSLLLCCERCRRPMA